jgi:hypothetical protein
MKRLDLRIPTVEEPFIELTMFDPCHFEVLLKDDEEEDIEEILNHEIIHAAIFRTEGYLATTHLDGLTWWEKAKEDGKLHLAFSWRGWVIFQLPLWECFSKSHKFDKTLRLSEQK